MIVTFKNGQQLRCQGNRARYLAEQVFDPSSVWRPPYVILLRNVHMQRVLEDYWFKPLEVSVVREDGERVMFPVNAIHYITFDEEED